MTREELLQRITHRELIMWAAFYDAESKLRADAQRKAQARARIRSR